MGNKSWVLAVLLATTAHGSVIRMRQEDVPTDIATSTAADITGTDLTATATVTSGAAPIETELSCGDEEAVDPEPTNAPEEPEDGGTDPVEPPEDGGTDPVEPPEDGGSDPVEPPGDGGSDPVEPPVDGGAGNEGSAPAWEQCGGLDHDGPTECAEGTCTEINEYYHQCIPEDDGQGGDQGGDQGGQQPPF